MIKKILPLALAVAAGGSALALGPQRVKPQSDKFKVIPFELTAPQKTATRAEGDVPSVDFSLADQAYSATGLDGLPLGTELYQAFEFSEQNTKIFAGDQITSINVTTGAVVKNNDVYDNDLTEVTVFIMENLNDGPVYTQTGTLGTDILTQYKIELDTPYDIKAGTPFYVGYYFKLANKDLYYLVYDGLVSNNSKSCMVGYEEKGKVTWGSFADQIGALCIGCTVTGETMPQNGVMLDELAVPIYANPGDPFQCNFLIKTTGYSTDNIELTYKIGDGESKSQTITFEKTIPYNQYAMFAVDDLVCNQMGLGVGLKFEITKVNGVANTSTSNKKTTKMDCFESSKGFPRVHLIEEGTGTWCGWCPLGIVMMEYVGEKYPGFFSRVAIHTQDAMTVSSTSPWLNKYGGSFPCGYINRVNKITSLGYGNLAMMQNEMDDYVTSYTGVPSVLGFTDVAVSISEQGEMTVDTKVGSALDLKNNNRYRLSYYITQDGMGPYAQTNNYSGGQRGEMAGWDKEGKSVKIMYNEVCRLLVGGVAGVANSFPDAIVSGEDCTFSETFDITGVKADKFILIPFITDSFTGEVFNSKIIEVENSYFAGVEDVVAGSNVVSRTYYNINGVEVKEPSNGIYIVRSVYSDGTVKTSKTAIK